MPKGNPLDARTTRRLIDMERAGSTPIEAARACLVSPATARRIFRNSKIAVDRDHPADSITLSNNSEPSRV